MRLDVEGTMLKSTLRECTIRFPLSRTLQVVLCALGIEGRKSVLGDSFDDSDRTEVICDSPSGCDGADNDLNVIFWGCNAPSDLPCCAWPCCKVA